MPTGYTADVCDGKVTALPAFLRQCARKFMLDLREEAWDAPLPRTSKVQQSGIEYHTARHAEVLTEIHRLHGLTATQVETEAAGDHDVKCADYEARQEKKRIVRERYDAMIVQVRAWNCPPAMANMKSFALEQLTEAQRFDAPPPDPTFKFDQPPQKLDGPEWLSERLTELERQAEYHSAELAKATERQRNWSGFYATICDEIERLERT